MQKDLYINVFTYKSMTNLSKREEQVLAELLKNARASDQSIAKKIKTSRPTIAKVRKRLEQKGIILRYATKTNWAKLGLHITAVTIYKWKDYSRKTDIEANIKYIKNYNYMFPLK